MKETNQCPLARWRNTVVSRRERVSRIFSNPLDGSLISRLAQTNVGSSWPSSKFSHSYEYSTKKKIQKRTYRGCRIFLIDLIVSCLLACNYLFYYIQAFTLEHEEMKRRQILLLVWRFVMESPFCFFSIEFIRHSKYRQLHNLAGR